MICSSRVVHDEEKVILLAYACWHGWRQVQGKAVVEVLDFV